MRGIARYPARPVALPDVPSLIPRVVEQVLAASQGVELSTYLVGVRATRLGKAVPPEALEAWKGEVKRGVGKAVWHAWGLPARTVAAQKPDALFVWDADRERLEVALWPVFLYGRYAKLVRGLPQTRAPWRCEACRGGDRATCAACRGTGLLHPVALEDLLAGPVARAFGTEPSAVQLHGMGREDVDVRCLGAGRPFVLEVGAPRRRLSGVAALPAAAAEVAREAAGRLELPVGLTPTTDRLVARVKAWSGGKVYRAVAEADGPLDPAAAAAAVAALRGATLEQRTPRRVAHRRADLVRKRRVRSIELLSCEGPRAELRLEADGGTYIKELVSGDEGRTTPSFSGLVRAACRCAELDVLEVRADDAAILGSSRPPGLDEPSAGDGD